MRKSAHNQGPFLRWLGQVWCALKGNHRADSSLMIPIHETTADGISRWRETCTTCGFETQGWEWAASPHKGMTSSDVEDVTDHLLLHELSLHGGG